MSKTVRALRVVGLFIFLGLVSCDSHKVSDSDPSSHPNNTNHPARLSDSRELAPTGRNLLLDRTYLRLAEEGKAFEEITSVMDRYIQAHPEVIGKKGSGHKIYRRWVNRWQGRTRPGEPINQWRDRYAKECRRQMQLVGQKAKVDKANGSEDPSSEWTALPLIPSAGRIIDAQFDPTNPDRIYAAVENGGLWVTENLGRTWRNISDAIPDLPSRNITNVVVHSDNDPNHPSTLYAFSPTTRHLYKTTDDGSTWTLVSSTVPIGGGGFTDLISTIVDNKLVFVGNNYYSPDASLVISRDEGRTWTSYGQFKNCYGVAFHPTNNSIIYLATPSQVYRSTDVGQSFQPVFTFPPIAGAISLIAVSANQPDWVWSGRTYRDSNAKPGAAIYLSKDHGVEGSWKRIEGALPQDIFDADGGSGRSLLAADPCDAKHLVAGAQSIYETTDEALHWSFLNWPTHLNAQLEDGSTVIQPYTHHNADQHFITFCSSPNFKGRVIRGCDTGLFLKDPDMENFHQWTNISGNMNAFIMQGIAVNEFGDRYIVTNTQDNDVETYQYGAWELKDRGYEGSNCWINPYTNIAYYPGASDRNPSPEERLESIERKQNLVARDPVSSTKNSIHAFLWPSSANPISAPSYTNPNKMYFKYLAHFGSTESLKWIYRSDDRGREFSKMPSPFSDDPDYINHVPVYVNLSRANPADPANPEILTAVFHNAPTSSSFLAQSSDGGSSWSFKQVPGNSFYATSAVVDPNDPRKIWLAGYYGGVYKTVDGGEHWTSIRGSLPRAFATKIVLHEGSPEDLYVLISGHGVYHRGQGDEDWTLWMEGRTMRNFVNILVDYPNQKLVAASYGNAVWERSFPTPYDRFLTSVSIEQVGSCEGRFQTYRVQNPYVTPEFYNYAWTKNGSPIGLNSEYLVTDQVVAADNIRCAVNPRNFESLKKTSDPITISTPCSGQFPQSWGNALEVEHVIGPTSLGYYDVATANQDFTIECWLSPTSYGTVLANRRASEHDAKGWILFTDEETVSLRYAFKRLGNGETENSAIISSAHPVDLKNWVHLAVSFQRDGKVTLYINGQSAADAEISGEANIGLNSLFDLSVFTDVFGYGRMSGAMDELRIWSESRTADQIKDNLNKTLGQISQADQQSIVAYFPFDETSPSEVQETFTRQSLSLGTSRAAMIPSTVSSRHKHIEVFELSLDRSDFSESIDGATALTSAGVLDGTVFNNPLLVSGQIGGGLFLNGEDQYISVPAMNLDSNQVTLSAWIRRQGDQKPNTGIVFSRDGTTVAGLRFGENNQLSYTWGDVEWSSDLVPAENQWCFVVLVISPESASIYLNGENRDHSATHASQAFDGVSCIGQDSAGGRFFRGEIDQPTVWDDALTSAEIQAEYKTVHDRLSEKKVHFTLDPVDVKGTDIINRLAGSGDRYGTAHGGPGSVTLGQVGGALQFDGVDDYLSIPPLGLTTNTLTLSAWIRSDKIQNAGTGLIFSRPNSGGIGLNFLNNNELSYTWGTDQGWSSGQSVLTGIWSHVVLVIEPNQVTIYLNGVGKSRSRTNALQDISAITRIASDSMGEDRYFAGGMDEVAIWNRALGSNEIYSMYRNGRLRRQVLHYTMSPSDVSLDTLENVSEYAELDGQLVGETVFVDGQIGQAIRFDGNYGLIPSMDLNTNTLTITGWMKRHGPQPRHAGIVYSRAYTIAGINLLGNSELSYTWGNHYDWSTGLTLPDEGWSFFALVIQPHEAAMYLNGSKKTHLHDHEILGFTAQTDIGRDPVTGHTREINADLDEIQLWNRALLETEILSIYEYQRTGRPLTKQFELSLDRSDLSGSTALTVAGTLDGTLVNHPLSVSGQIGGGLLLNGTDQYLTVPPTNTHSNHITMSAWIRRQGDQSPDTGIIVWEDSAQTAGLQFGENNQLRYTWNGASWDSGLVVPDNQWCFVALAIDPDKATLFLDDDVRYDVKSLDAQLLNTEIFIGRDPTNEDGYFTGKVDQVRFWTGTMPLEEVIDEYAAVQDLLDSKRVHYTFDSSDIVNSKAVSRLDSLVGNLDGTIQGDPAPVSLPVGQVGGALQFDGQSDYVVTPALDGLETNTITFSIWVRPEESEVGYAGLIYNRTVGPGLDLQTISGSKFKVGYNWNSDQWRWDSGLTLRPKRWSHVALVVEPNQATLYVNGKSSTHDVSQNPHPKILWTSDTLIGLDAVGGPGRYFSGGIDEVAIWNRALRSQEIDKIYENGRSRREVLHYTMDTSDISGTTLKNTSGDTSFNATLTGSPESAPGILGQALRFDGEGKYGTIPPMHLNSSHVTITGWMKKHGDQINYAGVIYNRISDTIAGVDIRAQYLGYTWNDADFNWNSGLELPDETWFFFALVVQPDQATMYLNESKASNGSEQQPVLHAVQPFSGETNIGHDFVVRYINADLDEIQIWNRALQDSEIMALYQNLSPDSPAEKDSED